MKVLSFMRVAHREELAIITGRGGFPEQSLVLVILTLLVFYICCYCRSIFQLSSEYRFVLVLTMFVGWLSSVFHSF